MDNDLSTVRLSWFGLRREPPRAVDDRATDYERLFDFDTLFYDVFRDTDPRQVICLGPPLLNCEAALSTATFEGPGSHGAIAWEYRKPKSHYQPTSQFRLSGFGIATADRVLLRIAGREIEIPIRPSGHSRLAGRRVVMTLSKDNPLTWIRDWAEFNARVHGADAVLFYDNGSVTYDLAELSRVLETVPGIDHALVVPWRFPYGPGTGPKNIQDSFYCQPGALDHARRRFCPSARAVLNTDIDELVVSASGASIFETAEMSGKAAIAFSGYWVDAPTPVSPAPDSIRHFDFMFAERWRALFRRVCPFRWLLRMKWIVVPGRCPEDVDWGVHDLYAAGIQSRRAEASWKSRPRDVFYRHFRRINTGWKTARGSAQHYSAVWYSYDRELAQAFANAFPERAAQAADKPHGNSLSWFPDWLRRGRRAR